MKIFDSFRFFNELEILEIRFNILYDVVDYFVITESPYTTMGDSKPQSIAFPLGHKTNLHLLMCSK